MTSTPGAWGVIRGYAGALLDLIYPPACAACGREVTGGEVICPACLCSFTPSPRPACASCGAPVEREVRECDECPNPRYFERAVSLYDYHDDRMRRAIHELKFAFRDPVAQPLAGLLVDGYGEFFQDETFDAIVPVPLHKKRLRQREFNQAALLAVALSRALNATLREDWTARIRNTRPQFGLPAHRRPENIRGAFTASEAVRGASILVVDDIYTTGETVNELSRVLKEAGAARVCVLTLSRSSLLYKQNRAR